MSASPETTYLYDGRLLIGLLKPLADGTVEAFVADHDGTLTYVGKGESRGAAAAIVHARRARLEGAPTGGGLDPRIASFEA